MLYTALSAVTIVAVATVFGLYLFVKKKSAKDRIHAVYFFTVFIVGVLLFSLGLSYGDVSDGAGSPLFLIAAAVSLSLKSFCWDFGVSSVSALASGDAVFSVAVFVHFIAAVMFTFLIAVKLFGKNVVNAVRVFVNRYAGLKYMVVGVSEEAEVFLQSLGYKDRRPTTVILDVACNEKKNDLIDGGFAVVVIKDGEDENESMADMIREALERAGLRHCGRDTKIFAMSGDDEVNMLTAKIVTDHIVETVKPEIGANGRVKKLSLEQEKKLGGLRLSVYAMYETLDRTEFFTFRERAFGRVHFFNPYEIRARKLAFENPITSLIPKEWINTEKARLFGVSDAGHGRPYRIMNFFVGYGRTNRQILKKCVCNNQLLGVDYNALIIDKVAADAGRRFQSTAPGLFNRLELKPNSGDSVYYRSPEEAYNIVFEDLNVLSSDFYDRIIREIDGVDGKEGYDFATVVIALGTDILNIETALTLRQKLYERKLLKGKCGEKEYDRVRIFVKLAHYNVMSEYILNDKGDIDNEIIAFGALDEIINEGYIIGEKTDLIAERIANNYWATAGKGARKTNAVTKWDTLTEFKRESNRYAALSIRTKLNLLGFEFKERENETNDDAVRKDYGARYGIDVSKRRREEKESGGKFVDFVERDADGGIIDNARNNLARLEHQRWNTVHLVGGWTKLEKAEVTAGVRQDEKSKRHACITTFEGLSELRERQADDALAKAEKSGEQPSRAKALSDADTMCYDFDLMDMLFELLDGSGYYVALTR